MISSSKVITPESGLEILWVENNPFSVKKLIPLLETYPDSGVITLDDDIIYHRSLLAGLKGATEQFEGIVGYVGKALVKREQKLDMYFREPKPADKNTPCEQVYLIGWGGIYYPPKSLDERVTDMKGIHQIVPGRGSDIWFWAAAQSHGTPQYCLGVPIEYNLGIPIPQTKTTKPKDQPGHDVVTDRFQKAIDFFGIRDKLLKDLPNYKADE
jgi:hypothetical protein